MSKTQRAAVLVSAVLLGALAAGIGPAVATAASPVTTESVALAGAAGQAAVGPPLAERPTRLAGQLTDSADVLGAHADETRQALETLRRETGLQLFVVFVRTFSGQPAQSWAEATATRSDLGDRDALLAVATRDRAYAYSFAEDYPLTDAQLAEVAQIAIEPALAENDWAGAVVGAAAGYRAAEAGQPIPEPVINPGPPDERTLGELVQTLAWIAVPLLLIVGGLLAGWWWRAARRRRAAQTARQLDRARTEEVAARANILLVELDNELRASEQELALAVGQYGPEATAGFTAALQSARQEVTEAFRLRISLDEEPIDEPTKRQRLMEIITRCEAADQRLDSETEAFDQLRQLESQVEQRLAELHARRESTEHRAQSAATALAQLQSRYLPEVLVGVVDNPESARDRLGFAAERLTEAGKALGRQDRPRAVLAVRTAEEALGQAAELIEVVEAAGPSLETTHRAVDALLVELDEEIAQGRTILSGTSPSDALAAAVDQAVQVVTEVGTALAQPLSDPSAALRRLETADDALDAALAVSIETEQRIAHARALLDSALAVAAAEIQAANGYLSARRGAVGERARTLLAEAQRQQARAQSLAAPDPVAALAAAHDAGRKAGAASRSARADVSTWSAGRGRVAGFDERHSEGDGAWGALLGGILSGDSGRSRYRRSRSTGWGGGFGGSTSRTSRSGGSSGRSGSSRRSGGGSTRRSGGGRRGGGGRF